jgi:hypothetical protein
MHATRFTMMFRAHTVEMHTDYIALAHRQLTGSLPDKGGLCSFDPLDDSTDFWNIFAFQPVFLAYPLILDFVDEFQPILA